MLFVVAAVLAGNLGHLDEAITLDHRSIELDPLRPNVYHNLGNHLYYAGKFKEAETSLQKTLELAPQRSASHGRLGLVYLLQSQFEKALAEFQKEPVRYWRQQGFALYYFATGNKKEADSTLDQYIKESQTDAAFQVAEIYAYRNESDKAFEWLERAYKIRDGGLAEMKRDPPLRNRMTTALASFSEKNEFACRLSDLTFKTFRFSGGKMPSAETGC